MKTSYKIIHAIFAGIIRCVLRIHVSGAENDLKYDEGVLLCANHVSLLDPVTICASIRHTEPLFMSKKELFKVPVVRHIIRAFGAYPVERGGADMGAMKKNDRAYFGRELCRDLSAGHPLPRQKDKRYKIQERRGADSGKIGGVGPSGLHKNKEESLGAIQAYRRDHRKPDKSRGNRF